MEKRDKLFFGLVIICILLVSFLVFYMRGEAGKCVKDPFVYGAKRMGAVDCSCLQYNNPSCPAKFSFNETSIVARTTKCQGVSGLTNYPRGIAFDIAE